MRLFLKVDFDAVISAMLLKKVLPITEIHFIAPLDIIEGKIKAQKGDVVANLPYLEGCEYWFDHHPTNTLKESKEYKGLFRIAPSAAGLIYEYFGGEKTFPNMKDLIVMTDRIDAAELTIEEVKEPKEHLLIANTIDSKTFIPAAKAYDLRLIEIYGQTQDPEKILQFPEVKIRAEKFQNRQDYFREMLKRYTRLEGNIIVTDIRFCRNFPRGDRFFVYTMFPKATLAIKAFHTKQEPTKAIVSVTQNIFNRSKVHVGNFCKNYDGGGHEGAAICRFPREDADKMLKKIFAELNELDKELGES